MILKITTSGANRPLNKDFLDYRFIMKFSTPKNRKKMLIDRFGEDYDTKLNKFR